MTNTLHCYLYGLKIMDSIRTIRHYVFDFNLSIPLFEVISSDWYDFKTEPEPRGIIFLLFSILAVSIICLNPSELAPLLSTIECAYTSTLPRLQINFTSQYSAASRDNDCLNKGSVDSTKSEGIPFILLWSWRSCLGPVRWSRSLVKVPSRGDSVLDSVLHWIFPFSQFSLYCYNHY